jgi:hypothetical protein
MTFVLFEEFVDDLTGKIWANILPYIFVAYHQTQVLTQYRGSLNECQCITLVCFAENYNSVMF